MPKITIQFNGPSVGYNPPNMGLAQGAGPAPFQAAAAASRQRAIQWGNMAEMGQEAFRLGLTVARQDEEAKALAAFNKFAVREAQIRTEIAQNYPLDKAAEGRTVYLEEVENARREAYEASGIRYKLGEKEFYGKSDQLLARADAWWTEHAAGERQKYLLSTLAGDSSIAAKKVRGGEVSLKAAGEQIGADVFKMFADVQSKEFVRLVYNQMIAPLILADVARLQDAGKYGEARAVLEENKNPLPAEVFNKALAELTAYEKAQNRLARHKAAYDADLTPEQYSAEAQKQGTAVEQKMWELSRQAASKTGIDPRFIYAQWRHETVGFNSRLMKENHNFAGLTQIEPNGEENRQPDGANYYMKFASPEAFVEYYVKYISHPDYAGVKTAKTLKEFARALKAGGYYTDGEDNYAAGLERNLSEADAPVFYGGSGALEKERDAAEYTKYYSSQKERLEWSITAAKVSAANDLYLLLKEGEANPVTIQNVLNKALRESNLTGANRVTLEKELSALALSVTSAPQESDTQTKINLQKMDRDNSLTREIVDATYKGGKLSTEDYLSFSDKAFKIVKDAYDKQTKAADRQIEAAIDRTLPGALNAPRREEVKAGMFSRLDALGLVGFNRKEKADAFLKDELNAPGSAVNWWKNGQLEVERAKESWGPQGNTIVGRIRESLQTAVRRPFITGQEVNEESTAIAELISEGSRVGDYTWQTVFNIMLQEGEPLTKDNFIATHEAYMNRVFSGMVLVRSPKAGRVTFEHVNSLDIEESMMD
jgi:flagellum-specific peptidoglycan hydrolase FlgJ